MYIIRLIVLLQTLVQLFKGGERKVVSRHRTLCFTVTKLHNYQLNIIILLLNNYKID